MKGRYFKKAGAFSTALAAAFALFVAAVVPDGSGVVFAANPPTEYTTGEATQVEIISSDQENRSITQTRYGNGTIKVNVGLASDSSGTANSNISEGTITLIADGKDISGNVRVIRGTASFSQASLGLEVGTYKLTAKYSGCPAYNTSVVADADAVTLRINKKEIASVSLDVGTLTFEPEKRIEVSIDAKKFNNDSYANEGITYTGNISGASGFKDALLTSDGKLSLYCGSAISGAGDTKKVYFTDFGTANYIFKKVNISFLLSQGRLIDGSSGVSVISSSSGGFSSGLTLSVSEVSTGDVHKAAGTSLSARGVSNFVLYDISVTDAEKRPYSASATLMIPIPSSWTKNPVIFYLDDKGAVQAPLSTSVVTENGTRYASATTSHFSLYAIGEVVSSSPGTNPSGGAVSPSSTVYRLYNPNSGEHFFTANAQEYAALGVSGWSQEGVAFNCPPTGNAVYRVYNPNSGYHHYTVDPSEKNALVSYGWSDEGVAFCAKTVNTGTVVWKSYNPFSGQHMYTRSLPEYNNMVAAGWKGEGVGWYTSD